LLLPKFLNSSTGLFWGNNFILKHLIQVDKGQPEEAWRLIVLAAAVRREKLQSLPRHHQPVFMQKARACILYDE
jgi:hypothetical protein